MIIKELVNYVHIKKPDFNLSSLLNIKKKRLDQYLVEEDILKDYEIKDFWINYLGFDGGFNSISDINKNIIDKIGLIWILKNRVIPYDESIGKIKIIVDDLSKIDLIMDIEKIFNKKSEIILKTSNEVEQILDFLNADLSMTSNFERNKVNKLLNSYLKYAFDNNASDIHFDIESKHVVVKYRIDGVLNEMFKISFDLYLLIVNKVKILSELDLTNNITPQDGHFIYRENNKQLDIRVSIVPTLRGSRMVLRIFHNENINYDLNSLGFTEEQLINVKSCLNKAGLVVVTGPTGSGKTTTLYSIINYLQSNYKNIMTIEDPVENELENITQIPLNKLDYPSILKSIVRQDPDVIMVGEIRDQETAVNSIRLAQTGHLVLTTIHSSDGLGVINKLLNMNIQKYLLIDCLNLIISQRLVRKPCEKCHFEYNPSKEIIRKLDLPKDISLKSTTGCKECLNTGYRGRIMISEVIKIDDQNKDIIFSKNNKREIYKLNKNIFMKAQVINKLINKEITIEEIIRNGIID